MPAINFKTQFAPPILAGKKPFTLRALRPDGRDPKAGQMLYLFTAMRTKACKKFAEKPCRLAETIKLTWRNILIPTVGNLWQEHELQTFAQLDGFNNYDEFCHFHKIHLMMETKPMRLVAWVTRDELKALLK